jgi:hypothetical protein
VVLEVEVLERKPHLPLYLEPQILVVEVAVLQVLPVFYRLVATAVQVS